MEDASFSSGIAAGENDAEIITSEAHNSSDLQNLNRQPQSSSGLSYKVDSDDIKVEGVYEIHHEELPVRTPIHLKTIRAVIVSEKTKLNVTVKFPSAFSLRNYFSTNSGAKSGSTEHPLLDEEFVMGTSLTRRVLHRKVPSLEFAQNKHLQGFWMISPMTLLVEGEVVPASTSPLTTTCTGFLTWGTRRKVRFLGRHRERPPSLCIVKAEGVAEVAGATKETRSLKRQREANRAEIKRKKKSRDKEKAKSNFKERWSKERYEAAEQKLQEILREQGAFLGNPILRPALRMEARKHIGDTGLLDHLLKHMAGMVSEERGERLRRSHNADGQMEYWLERADLDELRKQAGVKDPYWVPPPGWQPGDNPCLDPETTNQLKQLKEDVDYMRRDLEQLRSRKADSDQWEYAVASQNDPVAIASSLEEKYDRLLERYDMLEGRYEELSNMLKVVKEEMRVLSGTAREKGGKELGEQENGKARDDSLAGSGFRMCKPHGTFLWPNMARTSNTSSGQWMMQAEDVFSAATAPTPDPFSLPPLLALPPVPTPMSYSPVRPVPEKPVVVYARRSTSVMSSPEAAPCFDRWTFTGTRTISAVSATSSAFLRHMPAALPGESDRMPVNGHVRSISEADQTDRHLSPGTWLALATPSPSISNHA